MAIAKEYKFNALAGNFDLVNADLSAKVMEHTGFVNPDLVTITYDPTARTVTLGGTVEAYYQDGLNATLVSGYVTPTPHSATLNKVYWLYADGTGADNIKWLDSFPGMDKILIACCIYYTNYKFCIRESHGLNMPTDVHFAEHFTIGTWRSSGSITPGTYTLASTTAANKRPNADSLTIYDEDLKTVLPALTSKLYNKVYLTGTTASPVINFTGETAEIVPMNTGITLPAYNLLTGGNWTQAPMSSGNYQAIFVIAMPVSSSAASQAYRYLWVQGQQQSATLSTIQALTPSNVILAELATLAPEYVYFAKIIIQYVGGGTANWNIVSVETLAGNRATQAFISTGSSLTSVATDGTLTGAGTASSPLSVVGAAGAVTAGSVPFVGATANLTEDNANLYYDSTNKRIGVGTIPTTYNLEVVSPTAASAAENIAKFGVADASTSMLEIINASATDAVFAPTVKGTSVTSSVSPVTVIGDITASADSGATPAIAFQARKGAAVVNTRPLFKFQNYTTTYATVTAGGNWGFGGSVTPVQALHVDKGNATASYLQFTCGTTTGVSNADGYQMGIGTGGIFAFIQREALDTIWRTSGTTNALTLASTGIFTFDFGAIVAATDYGVQLNGGTTAQRHASPVQGMLRTNTDFDFLESYQNGNWSQVSKLVATQTSVNGTAVIYTPTTGVTGYSGMVTVTHTNNTELYKVLAVYNAANTTWYMTATTVGATVQATYSTYIDINSSTGALNLVGVDTNGTAKCFLDLVHT